MMKKMNFAPPARDLKPRIASALTVVLMVAVSVISILGIGSGTMLTAHAVEVIDVCEVDLTSTADGVKLTWNTIEGADSYEIYRKTGDGGYKKVAVADSTETSWVDESVTSNTTYTYYVQPVSEDEAWDYEEVTITYIHPHIIFLAWFSCICALAGFGCLLVATIQDWGLIGIGSVLLILGLVGFLVLIVVNLFFFL